MESVLNYGREFEFTTAHFSKVKSDLYEYAGIVLADHKKDMAYNRLVRRLRALSIISFDDYFLYIDSNPQEFSEFINALTTNLSGFFRERHHFDFIKSAIVPKIIDSQKRSIRVWSAGCSSGEEAYSIAMTLAQEIPNISQYDIKILATDIDSSVLQAAQLGIYDMDRVSDLDADILRRFFLKGVGSRDGKVQVVDTLKEAVTFKHLNLINHWPMQGLFDFIFCRNVMIYFNRETQQELVQNFYRYLKEDSYLFVGHSEALAHHRSDFNLIGKTIYQKKEPS
jgi:chemotaxis protein methyltransferase CheR